jgi:hypothetical protein
LASLLVVDRFRALNPMAATIARWPSQRVVAAPRSIDELDNTGHD